MSELSKELSSELNTYVHNVLKVFKGADFQMDIPFFEM